MTANCGHKSWTRTSFCRAQRHCKWNRDLLVHIRLGTSFVTRLWAEGCRDIVSGAFCFAVEMGGRGVVDISNALDKQNHMVSNYPPTRQSADGVWRRRHETGAWRAAVGCIPLRDRLRVYVR